MLKKKISIFFNKNFVVLDVSEETSCKSYTQYIMRTSKINLFTILTKYKGDINTLHVFLIYVKKVFLIKLIHKYLKNAIFPFLTKVTRNL